MEEVGIEAFDCLRRLQLEEIDCVHICVDLVSIKDAAPSELLVSKYAVMDSVLKRLWDKAFLLKRLKGCPYVVPFYKFIIDDVEPQYLGYTADYIAGATTREDLGHPRDQRPFRKLWLQQLLDVVGSLNINYGLVHQDIAP